MISRRTILVALAQMGAMRTLGAHAVRQRARGFMAGGFVPADLSSILAYWEADTGVLVDPGEGVHTFEDQAASFDLTQSTASAKPAATTREGLNVVRFDGGDFLRHATLGSSLTGNFTFWVAGYFLATATDQIVLAWGDNAAGERRSLWHENLSGEAFFSGYAANVDSDHVIDNGWHSVVVTWNGTTIAVRCDGVERATGTPSLVGYTATALTLGANNDDAEFCQTDVRDAGVCTAVVSGTDLSDLETYLAGRLP